MTFFAAWYTENCPATAEFGAKNPIRTLIRFVKEKKSADAIAIYRSTTGGGKRLLWSSENGKRVRRFY